MSERVDRNSGTHRDESKEKASASSNLAKLRDMYGDLGLQKEDTGKERGSTRDSSGEEVIRLGGSTWK